MSSVPCMLSDVANSWYHSRHINDFVLENYTIEVFFELFSSCGSKSMTTGLGKIDANKLSTNGKANKSISKGL